MAHVMDYDFTGCNGLPDFVTLLETVTKHHLAITGWQTSGPAGGNYNVTLSGTAADHYAWIDEFYGSDTDRHAWCEGVS